MVSNFYFQESTILGLKFCGGQHFWVVKIFRDNIFLGVHIFCGLNLWAVKFVEGPTFFGVLFFWGVIIYEGFNFWWVNNVGD